MMISEVRSLHHLTSVYKIFVKDFSTLVALLTKTVKKTIEFKWDDEQEKIFNLLEGTLIPASSIVIPDFTKIFAIKCDSQNKILSSLNIEKQPIVYFSVKLNGTTFDNPTCDKELYVLVRILDLTMLSLA